MRLYQARPTTYKGIPMRSRLEATFAAMFDRDGFQWLYEPRAYASERGQYLPDFEILADEDWPRTHRLFVEVRPTLPLAYAAMSVMPIIWESEPTATLEVVVGDDPLAFEARGRGATWRCYRVARWRE